MGVNQKQIAEKVGVSISLVSRVLSGRAVEIGIAQPTIDKVLETARSMGYIPNMAAQALKGKSTHTIGIVIYDFKDPFFGTVVHYLQSLAHNYDYSLLLVGFQNRKPDDRDLQPLSKFNLDGIIAVGSDLEENWLADFSHLPCARIGFGNAATSSLKITSDEQAGYEQLTEYLQNQNIKSATFVGADTPIHQNRYDALATAKGNLRLSALFGLHDEGSSFEVGRELTTQLIASDLPDVLICGNDRIAMGAIHAAMASGLQLPEELRVVGYDDIPAAAQFLPPLTTLQQPIARIAKEVFEAVANSNCPNETRLLTPKLIIRNSA